ncbi:MAG TPA: GNAT family N-acetyltransferase [Pseudomonadales bacterium]|nr:GNAT family N-acetyltransferase [Pseudomonadales bacterium]
MNRVTDNTARSRFELEENGLVAFADYRRRDGVLVIPHVEAPPALRGTGTSQRLLEGVLAIVRERGERVLPTCSYAAAYLRRHSEHHDLLA